MSQEEALFPLEHYEPAETVRRPRTGFPHPAAWRSNNPEDPGPQPELPIGEFCPHHAGEKRVLVAPPIGEWNRHHDTFYDRYRDTVYRCEGRDGQRRCSWAWSQQLGLFVPAGLDAHSVVYPTMYHQKRFSPRKWGRIYAPLLDDTQEKTP